MNATSLIIFFKRDLEKLKSEIEQYQNEGNLWIIGKGIANSGGNLCLHLVGNLRFFIGTQMGNTAFARQRDLEFSAKGVPRTELIKQIDETIEVVERTLSRMPDSDFESIFPNPVFKQETTTGQFLVHLATHLSYHLGQVNYHRRLLDIG